MSFSKINGIGRVKYAQLLSYFGNLENAWKASSADYIKSGIDSKIANSITNHKLEITPDIEIEKLFRYAVKAVPYTYSEYPLRLREITDFPPILYIRGNILPTDDLCIAVVGTRRVSVYGRQVTEEIVNDLARNNITIVSGLARGIDSIAHDCALNNNGRTIAVFASGLDIVYPAENDKLAQKIINNGAILSEYPLGTKPKAEYFPRRNRIMSGISLGVLVIEAGEKSGALITAGQALEQNREVFAIPGSIFSPYSKGTNNLIQQGAKLVRNYMDIMEELNLAIVAQQLEMKEILPTDQTESLLLKQLGHEPKHIDEVCRLSGLSSATVGSTLAILELKGFVRQLGNMNYVLARGTK